MGFRDRLRRKLGEVGIEEECHCRMAYADQKMGGGKIVAIIVVALIHAVLGYAFVTGLAFQYVKKAAENMDVFDVEEPPPPPPDEPPPPPPDQPLQPPPVVSPPPIVQTQAPVVVMQTVQTPPPAVVMTPVVAPPAPPPPPRVSQAAKLKPGDLQRLFGDPNNYPDSARDAGAQGSVAAALSVGADGRVTACSISSGSGNADLDRQTCNIATRRIRMTPAKDDDGNNIASNFTLRVRWQLPQD